MSHECQSILFAPNGRLLCEMASVSADFHHGQVIPEHAHPEDQLLFASSGVMTLSTKQGVWVVPPMRALWIPANTPLFFFQAEDGIRDYKVTGVQTCALPI